MVLLYLYSLSFCLYLTLSEGAIKRPRGVPISKAAFYDPSHDFPCFDGSAIIPFAQINDDYCDCTDGSDEPGTPACPNGTFHCTNAGHLPKYIPSSRVNDGICDCCDGTDEYSGKVTCANYCKELGKQHREEEEKKRALLIEGHELYKEYCFKGQEARGEKQERLEELKQEKANLDDQRNELEAIKITAEEPEKEAKEKHMFAWKAEKEKQEAELTKIKITAAFEDLDNNRDKMVSYQELQAHPEFDIDSNGDVSNEEAREYLEEGNEADFDTFSEKIWPHIKDIYKKSRPEGEPEVEEPPVEKKYSTPQRVLAKVPKQLTPEKQKAKEEKKKQRRKRRAAKYAEDMGYQKMPRNFKRHPRLRPDMYSNQRYGSQGWESDDEGPWSTSDAPPNVKGTQQTNDQDTGPDMEGVPPGMLHPEMEGYPHIPSYLNKKDLYHDGPPLDADVYNNVPPFMDSEGPDGLPLGPDELPLDPDELPLGPDGLPLDPDELPLGPDGLPHGPDGLPLDPDGLPLDPDDYYAGIPRGMRPDGQDDPEGYPNITPEMRKKLRDQWEYVPTGDNDPDRPLDPYANKQFAKPGKWKYKFDKDTMKYQPFMEPPPYLDKRPMPDVEGAEGEDDEDGHPDAEEYDIDDEDDDEDDADEYDPSTGIEEHLSQQKIKPRGDSGDDSGPNDEDDVKDMPEYDESTKKFIEIADKARAAYNEVNDLYKEMDNEISEIEGVLATDMGEKSEFYLLKGECYEFVDREYTYKMCPYNKATQRDKRGGMETSLGTWGTWNELGNKYDAMKFDKGQNCWNGPDRSVKVNLHCGIHNELVSASEPNKCEYEFKFITPSVCRTLPPDVELDPHDEL